MKLSVLLPLTLALVATAISSNAQNTPRGVAKQARADRKMDQAHRVRQHESLTKVPKVVREEDKHDHKSRHRL